MNRKEFIKSTGKTVAGIMVGGWILQSCGTLHYASATEEKDLLIIKKSEFLNVRKNRTVKRNLILVHAHKIPAPIGIHRSDENQYTAVLLQCTHRGCELNSGGNIFTCPCHGSEFSMEGEVLEGPAEEHLQTYNITTDHENIYIHL